MDNDVSATYVVQHLNFPNSILNIKFHTNTPNLTFHCCFPVVIYLGKHTGDLNFISLEITKAFLMLFNLRIKPLILIVLNTTSFFFSDKSLIGHLKTHLRSGVSIICPFNSCTRSFAKVQSFLCHLTNYHKQKATSNEIIHINDCNKHSLQDSTANSFDKDDENYNSSFVDQHF